MMTNENINISNTSPFNILGNSKQQQQQQTTFPFNTQNTVMNNPLNRNNNTSIPLTNPINNNNSKPNDFVNGSFYQNQPNTFNNNAYLTGNINNMNGVNTNNTMNNPSPGFNLNSNFSFGNNNQNQFSNQTQNQIPKFEPSSTQFMNNPNIHSYQYSNINTNTNTNSMGNTYHNQPQFNNTNNQSYINNISSYQNTTLSTKREYDKEEIIKTILDYANMSNSETVLNRFKFFFYNKLNTDIDPRLIYALTSYEQYKRNGKELNFIEKQEFDKAVQKNPSPNEYYPVQISSTYQLYERYNQIINYSNDVKFKIDSIKESNTKLKNELENLKITYLDKEEEKLDVLKREIKNLSFCIDEYAINKGQVSFNINLLKEMKHKTDNQNEFLLSSSKNPKGALLEKVCFLENNSMNYGIISREREKSVSFEGNSTYNQQVIDNIKGIKHVLSMTYEKMKLIQLEVSFIKNDLSDINRYGKVLSLYTNKYN